MSINGRTGFENPVLRFIKMGYHIRFPVDGIGSPFLQGRRTAFLGRPTFRPMSGIDGAGKQKYDPMTVHRSRSRPDDPTVRNFKTSIESKRFIRRQWAVLNSQFFKI